MPRPVLWGVPSSIVPPPHSHHPPRQGVATEVRDLQGLTELDALRDLRDVCDRRGVTTEKMPPASRNSKPFLSAPRSNPDTPWAAHHSGTRPAPPAA